jgi:hypothetical protein
LVQQGRDRIFLEVVKGPGWSDEIAAKIQARFATFFESDVKFAITPVVACTKTKSGKRNPIISRAT